MKTDLLPIWTGVLAGDPGRVTHFWYRDISGVALRLCDGDTSGDAPDPEHEPNVYVPCPVCKDIYVDDIVNGRAFLDIQLDPVA